MGNQTGRGMVQKKREERKLEGEDIGGRSGRDWERDGVQYDENTFYKVTKILIKY